METPEERSPSRGRGAPPPAAERRAYAEAWESRTLPVVSRASRELAVTLSVQPVFDLERSAPVSRRLRRTVRHVGGERALGLGGRTLEISDLQRIDLLTLREGLAMLRLGLRDSGILPAFWRTIVSSRGRFALLCAELRPAAPAGALLVEVSGGLDLTPPPAMAEAVGAFERSGLGVILHLTPDIVAVERAAGVGARCLALDFAGVAHADAADWRRAADLTAAARAACGQVLLLNLRPDRALAARAAGATHAVFADMEPLCV